jgi:hypothetical protein
MLNINVEHVEHVEHGGVVYLMIKLAGCLSKAM